MHSVTTVLSRCDSVEKLVQIRKISGVGHTHLVHKLICVDLQRQPSYSLRNLAQQNKTEVTVYKFALDGIVECAVVGPLHNFCLCFRKGSRVIRQQPCIMQQ